MLMNKKRKVIIHWWNPVTTEMASAWSDIPFGALDALGIPA
jgi:hypothetical protein